MKNNDFLKFCRGIDPHCTTRVEDYLKYQNNILMGGYVNPTIIEERQMNVASMDVFSRLMMDRIIVFGSDVNTTSADIVRSQLLYLNSVNPELDITLHINSPGGSVDAGMGVIDTMNYIKADVSTLNVGLAASMGAMFLACGEKGKRYSLKHSRTMIHQPLGGAQGQATEILSAAREIEKCREMLYEILAEQTGQPIEKIKADAERDFWLSADEAVAYGLIDEVIIKQK